MFVATSYDAESQFSIRVIEHGEQRSLMEIYGVVLQLIDAAHT